MDNSMMLWGESWPISTSRMQEGAMTPWSVSVKRYVSIPATDPSEEIINSRRNQTSESGGHSLATRCWGPWCHRLSMPLWSSRCWVESYANLQHPRE
jgi:hypothetical protein